MRTITTQRLIILTSIFTVLFYNVSFFEHVIEIFPLNAGNIAFLISLALLLYALIVVLLGILSSKYILKPIIIVSFISASAIAYFMQSYNIVMDRTMIENILQTNMNESMDLMSVKLLIYLAFLGFLPAFIVYKVPVSYKSFKKETIHRFTLIIIHFLLMVLLLASFYTHYSTFFREHKVLRFYTNPVTAIYSLVAYTHRQFRDTNIPMKKIGMDAIQIQNKSESDTKRKIVIMVVGEAARADHFSLNGYKRETNPLLKQEEIINFSEMYSCGTTTAISVPCMFSIYDRKSYNSTKGYNTYSVLDVLSQAGVEVLWRENNSDSKGVAVRLPRENYQKSKRLREMCKGECRDVVMIDGLDKVIEKNDKDIIIVLHQLGNHGPAYFKRYPEEFKKFTPVCETNQLETCSQEEIANAYDNALLYTDYFLHNVINFLKQYEKDAHTAMVYVSDHGESLGENGFYLHGLPYFIAPDHQKHVGALMWFGKDYPLDKEEIKSRADNEYSHDNLFSTLLGLFNVQTKVYEKEMDILSQ